MQCTGTPPPPLMTVCSFWCKAGCLAVFQKEGQVLKNNFLSQTKTLQNTIRNLKKILHVDFNTLNNPHLLPNENGTLQYIRPYPSPPPTPPGQYCQEWRHFYEKPDQSEGSFTANTFPCSNGILLKMRKPSLSISPLV